MSTNASFQMSPEEFRRRGYAVLDGVAFYRRRVASLRRAESFIEQNRAQFRD
jgi:hypothetical protein